ncbi:MAG: 50S ribosomal protein L18, partial [Clostridia bacterium]|nr:50S ribosomal protein L18 [Clostridia bacterium]
MISKVNKNEARAKRHGRIRNKINGTSLRPRLSVYRST